MKCVYEETRVCLFINEHGWPGTKLEDFSDRLSRMCEKFHQLLAVGRWFPPGTPVSSTRKLISSSFHRLDMTLAVAEVLTPNKPNKPNG